MNLVPRSFRQLKREQIRQIIAAYLANTPKVDIARQFHVDSSTIRYHIQKFEAGNYTVALAYAQEAARPCTHPSLKCLLCGTAQDHIHRRELEVIRDLTAELAQARETLKAHDLLVE